MREAVDKFVTEAQSVEVVATMMKDAPVFTVPVAEFVFHEV